MAALRKPPTVARVLQRVTATARKHKMFEPSGCVVVAVSGGPDSLCLLHALARVRRLFRIELVCFHFDHRLRAGSGQDAAYVRRQADRLGVPFLLRAASSHPGRGESVEAWARMARYQALSAVVEERGGGVAAVGHTADDQAETILMALVQGSGLEALAGMRPVARPIVRPLLETTRQETEAFCRSLGLRPRRDPMNQDATLLRASIRRVLPSIEKAIGRSVRESIVRTGAHLREDADLLESMSVAMATGVPWHEALGSPKLLRRAIGRPTTDGYELDVDAVDELPRPALTRLIRRVLYDQGVRPETSHVEAVLSLIEARPGTRISLPGALMARREKGYVRLSRPSPA